MYLIYSCVPHFMSKELGPIKPRETGGDSSYASAIERAKLDQGFVLNMNQNIDGTWK